MTIQSLAIIGTGIMGMGIAQIAAQAGVMVRLFDSKAGAAQTGLDNLAKTLKKLTEKGKVTAEAEKATLAKVSIIDNLDDVAGVDLVVEAIIEDLSIKQQLFTQLEAIVSPDTILATNTSSLSVTAIAASCRHPERVAGFHFFNPVPLMKIVEVIAGLSTKSEVVDSLLALAKCMGHLGVVAKDTPGFIVNHAGRAFGTEALKILGEGVASTDSIDQILRDGAGFRMGAFELMDLTGLDVSHPVMESIFEQYYQEDRYRPHPLTRQMLVGKKLGRKVGEGFYQYQNGKRSNPTTPIAVPSVDKFAHVWVGADFDEDRQILTDFLQKNNLTLDTADTPQADSLVILATYGEDTTTAALRFKVNPEQAVMVDMLTDFNRQRTLMPSLVTKPDLVNQAHALFAKFSNFSKAEPENSAGMAYGVTLIQESVGLVAQRVLAMVINLNCDMAQQKIATLQDIDNAVKLGLGYPYGPISWGDKLGASRILLTLERIYAITGDPRYRPSPWLQRRARLDVSLFTQQTNTTV